MLSIELLTAVNMLLGMATMPAGIVQPDKVKSLHDVGAMVVKCYRPTATYIDIEIIERPYAKGAQWKAETSAVLRISYRGNYLRLNHQMFVAAMQREKSFMALPLRDSNKLPMARDCALKNWVSAE